MYLSTNKTSVKFINFLLSIILTFSLLGFLVDLKNTFEHGGIDLRNRVVGARLLNKSLDPYYFKWSQGQDERLLDPLDKPYIPVSRVTVPPTVLLLHSTFANLPYFVQRVTWLLFQWGAFIASLLILIANEKKGIKTKLLLILGFLFVSSNFWRIHTDVGQIYILYVLLLSLAYRFLQKEHSFKNFLGGCLIGLTASLRFPMIIMIIPMIIFRNFKILGTTIFSFCLCLSVSIILAGKQAWISYFSAMQTMGKVNLDKLELSKNTGDIVLPKTIEGLKNLTDMYGILQYNSSFQFNLKHFLHLNLSTNYLLVIISIVLLLLTGIIYGFHLNRISKSKIYDLDRMFMLGTLMIITTELLLPAPRYSYSDIQFIIPFLLIVKNLDISDNIVLLCFSFLLISLLLTIGLFSWFPYGILLGEYAIVIVMITMSFLLERSNHS